MSPLDPEAMEAFRAAYAVEKLRLDRGLQEETMHKTRELSAAGRLRSGGAARVMTSLAVNSLSVRSQVALNTFLRTWSAFGFPITDDNKGAVASFLGELLVGEEASVRDEIFTSASLRDPSDRAMAQDLLSDIPNATTLESKRISAELTLIAASNRRRSADQGPQMVFNAPVGLVQTGQGSFGTATQVVDSSASEALLKALDLLDEALQTSSEDELEDVAELSTDLRAELQKPKPNGAKVKAFVTGIGSTITFLPKLKAAYEAIKWAAAFIHVTLP